MMITTDAAEPAVPDLRFDIFPAIHLRNGQTIDFTGSDPDEAVIVDSWQPLETARFWIDEGASWIHIVDIDAMFQRDSSMNWQIIRELSKLPVKVQLFGGQVSIDDIHQALKNGVHRVLLDASQSDINKLASTALASYGPESIAVLFKTNAVEHLSTMEASNDSPADWPADWEAAGGEQAVARALQLYHLGITTGVHTTIAKNGTMSGCDVKITQELASLSGMNFVVGGEVYDMGDVIQCYNRKGVTGILVGRALYNGTINLQAALNKTRRKIAFETGLPGWKLEQVSLKARLRYAIASHFIQTHLPGGKLRVLDAGGGNGLDALSLASMGHTVDLLDESTAMITDFEDSYQYHPAADYITTHNCHIRDIATRFHDDQFDVIMCHNVIQYVADWKATLLTIIKPLKRGGVLSLITRNRHALPYQSDIDATEPELVAQLLDTSISHSPLFDSSITLFAAEELIDWLNEHQFVKTSHYGILSLHHYSSVTDQAENTALFSKLDTIETKLGEISPHRDVARYIQIIATRA
ncbi:MAG: HisA/HisF-related TIM barrel protein [Granulosicoccus sp.]